MDKLGQHRDTATLFSRMKHFDVCNGDADGLCAVRQWRLHAPAEATLVTGLKHDIALLGRVSADPGDEVLVCDIAIDRNRPALMALLERGVRVIYVDHHACREVPRHPGLQAHVDTGKDACTSLLVDRMLGGYFRPWALVGAYGDNLTGLADRLALGLGLDGGQRQALRRLGEAMNYNAYGDDEDEVLIAPAELYAVLARHEDPFELIANETVIDELDERRQLDLTSARGVAPHWHSESGVVTVLPDAAWSRRVAGTLANAQARDEPARAHAVLSPALGGGGWHVSLRAPLEAPGGASALAQHFGGSGRVAAAGIDRLDESQLSRFIDAFGHMNWG